jgi:hypothetical protein
MTIETAQDKFDTTEPSGSMCRQRLSTAFAEEQIIWQKDGDFARNIASQKHSKEPGYSEKTDNSFDAGGGKTNSIILEVDGIHGVSQLTPTKDGGVSERQLQGPERDAAIVKFFNEIQPLFGPTSMDFCKTYARTTEPGEKK